MIITNIKLHRIDDPDNARIKAIASVTLNNYIRIYDITLVLTESNEYLALTPALKLSDGKYLDHVLFKGEIKENIRKSIVDLYNSGENEYVNNAVTEKPNVEITEVKLINKNDNAAFACVTMDDCFRIPQVHIMKSTDGKNIFLFPSRKNSKGEVLRTVTFVNKEDEIEVIKKIESVYLNEIEAQKTNEINETKVANDESKSNSTNSSNDSVDAPGWDAITAEAERVYPNQKNPKHYAPLIKYRFGGKDPLDGISIYDAGDYWHFVTYGLSELYEKTSTNKEISGFGMEFTFKLKKDNYPNEEAEIKCICGTLQSIASITFTNKELINEYEYLYSGQTDGMDSMGKSNITGFITIPDTSFNTIETPNGKVKFVELIGVTDEELKSIRNKTTTVKELYAKLGSDVTNYNRNSVITNTNSTTESASQILDIKLTKNKKENPFDNSELKKLIQDIKNAKEDEKNALHEKILENIAEKAKVIVYVLLPEGTYTENNGDIFPEEGVMMNFPNEIYPNEKLEYFPVYTDFEELKKNQYINENSITSALTFDEYAMIILDNGRQDGLVINPYSETPYFITRRNLENMRNVKNNKMQKQANNTTTNTQKVDDVEKKITDNTKENELKIFSQDIEGYPTFKFYFPKNLGEQIKTNATVFEIKDGDIQKVRVMISRCTSQENLENDAKEWIKKNKHEAKMEEVTHRKETINNIPIEVYELKYIDHPEWARKIYKIGFVNNCRITISGWLVKGREEIINQAFEKIEW